MAVLLFDDEASAKHAHRAREREFTRFLGKELERNGLAGRQFGALLEVRKDHFVGARRGLFAPEVQTYRAPAAHDDGVRRVAALHQDHRLLITAARLPGPHAFGSLEPEEPDD